MSQILLFVHRVLLFSQCYEEHIQYIRQKIVNSLSQIYSKSECEEKQMQLLSLSHNRSYTEHISVHFSYLHLISLCQDNKLRSKICDLSKFGRVQGITSFTRITNPT